MALIERQFQPKIQTFSQFKVGGVALCAFPPNTKLMSANKCQEPRNSGGPRNLEFSKNTVQ
jgi:hypothetical protein